MCPGPNVICRRRAAWRTHITHIFLSLIHISIAAVDQGKVVDTSMGMTPLAGLMMGTRCGDLDLSLIHI